MEQLIEFIQTANEIYGGIIAIVSVLIGFTACLQCFFGYKLIRLEIGLCGAFIGGALGVLIGTLSGEETLGIICMLGGIVLGGWLAFKIYMIALFLLGLLSGFGMGVLLGILFGLENASIPFGFLIGLSCAVGVLILTRPVMILITAIPAGIQLGTLSALIFENSVVGVLISITMIGLGLWYQFKSTSHIANSPSLTPISVPTAVVKSKVEPIGIPQQATSIPVAATYEYTPQKQLELIHKKLELELIPLEQFKRAVDTFMSHVSKDCSAQIQRINLLELQFLDQFMINQIIHIQTIKKAYATLSYEQLTRCSWKETRPENKKWILGELNAQKASTPELTVQDYSSFEALIKDQDKWPNHTFELLVESYLIRLERSSQC